MGEPTVNEVSAGTDSGAEMAIGPDGASFFDAAGNVGFRNLQLHLTADGHPQTVTYDEFAATDAGLEASGPVGGSPLRCRTQLRAAAGPGAVVVRNVLVNATDRPVTVGDVEWGQFGDAAAVHCGRAGAWEVRFCHTDNVRSERYPYCDVASPYVRPIPHEQRILGDGQDQPFPAIYLTDRRYAAGVVFAAATQDRFYQVYRLRKAPRIARGLLATFAVRFDPCQLDAVEVPAGGQLVLEEIFVQLLAGRHPQQAYDDYVDWLAGRCDLLGPRTPLRTEAMHCTWNYGVFQEQYAADLLKTAAFIAENLPGVRYFLMDAGYMRRYPNEGNRISSFTDKLYPDPEAAVCDEKFPHGIRHYVAEVRKLGLKPGIWWSPTVLTGSPIYADHPDWFLGDVGGGPYLIGEDQGFLDLTVPDAREFMDRALAAVFGEWGFEALKMDFWSQMFEDRRARLRDGQTTAVETRTILFDLIRKHLGPDGVFMTCVAVGMGNPFIGQWADAYRNTIDIGAGAWHEQINNCAWALPTLTLPGARTFLLNNDSVGIDPALPDNENFFRLTYSAIHMGMIETGGRMEQWPPQYVAAMRKLTDRCDRGYPVRCLDERAFTGEPMPEVLYVDFPADSPTRVGGVAQAVALLNWTDQPKIVSVARGALGHDGPVEVEDFWTGRRETWDGEFVSHRLDPRSARLFDVLA